MEYRLAPENKFPVPLEDCYDAVHWAHLNFGRESRIVVCGESAGGNLAAGVSLMAAEEGLNLMAQVLIYPILTSDLLLERYEQSPDKHLLSYGNMQWFLEQYLVEEDKSNVLISPLQAKDLQGLPKTLIMTAEFDALCQEGKEYAEKLIDSGVSVVYKEYPKVIHGFLDIPIPSQETENAMQDLNTFLSSLTPKER